MKELDVFRDYLKKQKLKLTPQREFIASYIFSTHKHFTAEELIKDIRHRRKDISRATIYRTLDLLTKSRLQEELDFKKGKRVFEHTCGHDHHDHLICMKCGTIVEFASDTIENTQERILKKRSFIPITHSLRIFGLCKRCSSG